MSPIKSLLQQLLALGIIATAMPAGASDIVAAESSAQAVTAADQWLDIQRAGMQASPVPQSASPVWREKAAERLLRSLDADIPVSESTEGFSPGG